MTEDALRSLLRGLSRHDFETRRGELAAQHGVRRTWLDQIYQQEHAPSARDDLEDVEHIEDFWPHPVSVSSLLVGLTFAIARYIVASPEAIDAIAFWILHAHVHKAATHSPILYIWGPLPDCGKSTVLDLLAKLVPRPLLGAGLTLAYVLRASKGRTLLLDEAEKYFRRYPELEGYFCIGWQRGRLYGRCEGDANTPTEYDPWLPKACAGIGLPRDAQLLSRCIPVEMRRKLEHEEVEPFYDYEQHLELEDLRRQCMRFAADRERDLRHVRPAKPDGLRGTRPWLNWRPLLAIAEMAGADWSARAATAALALQPDGQDWTLQLLGDLRGLFEESSGVEFYETGALLDQLCELPEREYETANRGRRITGKWLAARLKPFGIVSQQPWKDGHKNRRGYLASSFEDAFDRYLTRPAETKDPCDPSDPRPTPSGSDGSDRSDLKAARAHEPEDFGGLF